MVDETGKATTEATDALTSVSQAVTGPGTPNNATVHTEAPRKLVWALVLAGPLISLMICGIIWVLAFKFWDDTISVEQYEISKIIVGALAATSNIMAILLGIVVFRLASGGLKSVRAQALGGNVEIATGGE